ncbi:hypothetical protein FQU76_09615 [Streptomyces qinzhouensis]|uniref:Uncharacterized protein n=1 Tax=Streptomyces qinzhouensis TaxID=2599401 RepID=A0A5B8JG77_9ACTN|nr:hypothetical protein FQU76_09615 [Streptomyces qinzhouensis]
MLPGAPARRRRRPLFVLAASVAALASLVGAFTLIQYYVAHPPSLSSRSERGSENAAMKPAPDGLVACSELIVEGTVARVEKGPADLLTVTLDVDTYLKPRRGPGRERIALPVEVAPEATVGTRMLVAMSRFGPEESFYYTGDDIAHGRAWVDEGLPQAEGLDCPGRG